MNFANLDPSVKKQIRASMKRIAEKLIILNEDKLDKIDFELAFNSWGNRYINFHKTSKYYNLTAVDEELFEDMKNSMSTIFERELNRVRNSNKDKVKSKPSSTAEQPATEKQLNYASYLMNMVKNKPLPQKKYSKSEISILINHLKKSIKS